MIYLAAPYTHADKAVRDARYKATYNYTQYCLDRGHIIFSPICYGHQFAQENAEIIPVQYWWEFNKRILRICSSLVVLKLPGWDKSHGVKLEIQYAKLFQIPVSFQEAL